MKPKAPFDLQIICHGWDAATESDQLLTTVTVRIFADIGNSTGSHFDYECHDPMQLWHFLRGLTNDPLGMMKEHFNYEPPKSGTRSSAPLPMDLNALFN